MVGSGSYGSDVHAQRCWNCWREEGRRYSGQLKASTFDVVDKK